MYRTENTNSNALDTDVDATDEMEMENTTYLLRMKIVFYSSFPIMISSFLGIGGSLINLYFAGLLSTTNQDNSIFAGLSLGNMFANVSTHILFLCCFSCFVLFVSYMFFCLI